MGSFGSLSLRVFFLLYEQMDYAGLGSLITVAAAALALVIKQLEQSRCKKINCCCVACDREVGEDLEVVVP